LDPLTCRRSCRAAASRRQPHLVVSIDIQVIPNLNLQWRARSLSEGPTLPVTRKCPASSSLSARIRAARSSSESPSSPRLGSLCHWQSATVMMDFKLEVSPASGCPPAIPILAAGLRTGRCVHRCPGQCHGAASAARRPPARAAPRSRSLSDRVLYSGYGPWLSPGLRCRNF
jgi:hypothetical protein